MINFTARYPIVLSLFFLIIAAAVSIFFYKNSSLSPIKKYFLFALKTTGIFLILFLFIEPSLIALIKGNSDKINLVLVDNSRSSLIPGAGEEIKKNEINKILDGEFFFTKSAKIFTFSSPEASLKNILNTDSIIYNGFETNLSSTLNTLKNSLIDENISAVTIISDGVFNSGGNPIYPVRLFQCPVFSIGIGDTVQKKDAVLNSLYFQKKAFTQTNNVIKAVVNSYILQDEILDVNIYREGELIQTKTISVYSNNQSNEVDFFVRESNPGIIRYSISITENAGEISYLNNSQDFLIEYIDNKTDLLVISSGPGYDNAVIQNILKRKNNYNLALRTVKNPNEFYEGNIDFKLFGELSAILLLGFPSSSFSTDIILTIAAMTQEYNIPLIFFAQKNTDYKKLEIFGGSIPFVAARPNSGEMQFSPQVVASPENVFNNISTELYSAPHIFRNVTGIIQNPGSVTLMTDKSSGEPVLITSNTGKSKSTAFMGYGLWRWDLNARASYEKILEKLIIESINITLLKDKKNKFKVYPSKDVFDYTENIKLIAEVYDDEYKLTRNAKVTANILQNGIIVSNNLKFTVEDNKYSAELPPLPAGDYKIEAEAELYNNFYARYKSRFLVDTVSTEYLITKSNFSSLRELSQNTGGEFFDTASDFRLAADKINSVLTSDTNVTPSRMERFNLWENKYWLLLIIILFSLEWAMRKRINIP